MIFYKTSSFGNDFIEIDEHELARSKGRRPDGGVSAPGTDRGLLAREICDRNRGVGADGVVFYRARGAGADFQIYNRDGGRAEISGNGMAGLAAVLFQRRLAASTALLQAAVGRRRVERLGRSGPVFRLNVEIGRPDFAARDFFPFLKNGHDRYAAGGLEFYPVSVGNPHAVVICRGRTAPGRLAALGKKLESHPMFPKRVNVEFVDFSAEKPSRVYFYERGVGPTQASSTGSAAVFAVLRRLGMVGDRLAIACGDERIEVSWRRGIFINTITRLVCRGEYLA